jgi:hypothetical protein
MQDQRRCLDERQQGAGVDLEGGPEIDLETSWAGDGAQDLGVPGKKAPVSGSAGGVDGGQGFGTPELVGLGDERVGDLGGHPDRVVVGCQVPGGRVGQDEGAGPLGSGRGEQQPHRPNVSVSHDHRPLRADRLHDRVQLLSVHLPGRQGIQR